MRERNKRNPPLTIFSDFSEELRKKNKFWRNTESVCFKMTANSVIKTNVIDSIGN